MTINIDKLRDIIADIQSNDDGTVGNIWAINWANKTEAALKHANYQGLEDIHAGIEDEDINLGELEWDLTDRILATRRPFEKISEIIQQAVYL